MEVEFDPQRAGVDLLAFVHLESCHGCPYLGSNTGQLERLRGKAEVPFPAIRARVEEREFATGFGIDAGGVIRLVPVAGDAAQSQVRQVVAAAAR